MTRVFSIIEEGEIFLRTKFWLECIGLISLVFMIFRWFSYFAVFSSLILIYVILFTIKYRTDIWNHIKTNLPWNGVAAMAPSSSFGWRSITRNTGPASFKSNDSDDDNDDFDDDDDDDDEDDGGGGVVVVSGEADVNSSKLRQRSSKLPTPLFTEMLDGYEEDDDGDTF